MPGRPPSVLVAVETDQVGVMEACLRMTGPLLALAGTDRRADHAGAAAVFQGWVEAALEGVRASSRIIPSTWFAAN